MDGLLNLVVIAVLAIPVVLVVLIVLVVTTRGRVRRLAAEVSSLRLELTQELSARRTGAGAAPAARPASVADPEAPAIPAAPVPVEKPVTPRPPPPPRPAVPHVPPAEQGAPREAPAVPVAAMKPPATPAPSTVPERGLEERFGTRWVVWVGGVALVLGGVFLVQYSIEQGLIGPAVRILLGALLAAVLLASGEYVRRYAARTRFAGVPAADIPSILTAAGTTVAFVTAYGAYALYGFLDPAVAFVLLGAVALATLAAALVHGPWLAGLGLVGAFATPALVATAAPNYWALAIYVLVVTAATFALARIRHWRWLALTGVVLGALWMLPGIKDASALPPHIFHAAAGFALVAAFIVSGFLFGPEIKPGRIEMESSGALIVYLIMTMLLVAGSGFDTIALVAFVTLTGATLAVGGRTEAATGAVPAAAILTLLLVASGFAEPGPATVGDERQLLVFGGGLAILFAAAGYAAQAGATTLTVATAWSATAAFAPVAILVALYYHVAGFALSLPFAAAALAMAALYATATERLIKRPPRPGSATAAALFATAAIAALALALTFGLDGGWLSVALALMVPGVAWVGTLRPLPALRWLAAGLVVVVMARMAWEPRIAGVDLSIAPIFNWLTYGYGVPAVSFWVAGILLRRRASDVPAGIVDAGAILFTVLLALLEIRHLMNGGIVYGAARGLAETGLQISVLLALAIGLERVRLHTRNIVHDIGALAVAGLALIGMVVVLLVGPANPWWTTVDVGGPVFNLVMLGYLLPAVLIVILCVDDPRDTAAVVSRDRHRDRDHARASRSAA